ncbi:T9SS type A sorting domain-containing protein [Chitinophaga cymbidii]|uniref:Secretion system C-terminal sorting domain-containing protein n=1 Tax=Chitinophaga cymbidii TaxID=1096750 RepID=A0A512RK66_9BACT|nr:T9SS type A sorting domain-containing protein [Chitinophaga cymbidii]GEP96068.1 hypothetical protein CCY01nite_23280 [Chitinophaga cymbidii]
MLKNFTFVLFIVLCTISVPAWSQSPKPLSENDSASKVIKAYPNPASTKIYFELQRNNDKQYEIIVYNFLGKKVDHFKNINQKTPVNLDNYYAGIYIFQLRDKDGNLVESGKFNVVK